MVCVKVCVMLLIAGNVRWPLHGTRSIVFTSLSVEASPQAAAPDTNEAHMNGTFDEQVAELMDHRQPKEKDLKAETQALADVELAMRVFWPDAKLTPYGSRFNGLGTAESDIDCFVRLPSSQGTNSSLLVHKAAAALGLYPHLFTQIRVKANVRVPIVEALHGPTDLDVDLNFSGIGTTKLINYFLELDDNILKLIVIIKHWQYKEVKHEKPSNYILILMAIFFLQQKQMVPPIVELQKNVEPHMEDNWNVAFRGIPFEPCSDLNLFELLIGFFEYYSNFPYDTYVISPFIGYPVHRERFGHYQSLPDEFRLYKTNMERNLTPPLDLKEDIVVQEAFDHRRNLVSALYGNFAQFMIAAFRKAHAFYQRNSNPDQYLKLIL